MADEPRFMDLAQACALLAITERHMRRLVLEKKIPVTRVGRLLRFERSEMERWIQRNTQRAS